VDERPTHPQGERLVLRVEISAEDGSPLGPGAIADGLRQLVVPAPPPPPVTAPAAPSVDDTLERLELDRRSAALDARETELDGRIAAVEREHRERIAELERTASEREEREDLTASEKIRLAQRARRTTELEQELGERMRDLDDRETRLDEREAEFEADVELREQRMERWRAELTDLEERLDRKERELLLYVGQVQGELSRRESGWWPTGPAPGTVRHH
jgi:hypothetical protein